MKKCNIPSDCMMNWDVSTIQQYNINSINLVHLFLVVRWRQEFLAAPVPDGTLAWQCSNEGLLQCWNLCLKSCADHVTEQTIVSALHLFQKQLVVFLTRGWRNFLVIIPALDKREVARPYGAEEE